MKSGEDEGMRKTLRPARRIGASPHAGGDPGRAAVFRLSAAFILFGLQPLAFGLPPVPTLEAGRTFDEEGPAVWRAAPRPAKTTADAFQAPPLREPDEEWVESTLQGMTIGEKIGQMIMPSYSSSTASSLLSTYKVCGFVFLGNDNLSANLLAATNSLQQASEVPLLFSLDCEAGAGARVDDATAFPMNMALAASGRDDLAFQQGVFTARECRAMGIQIAFGPVLDANTEPINPIIGIRSLSDDPATIERFAEPYVEGARSAGLLTTYKHYPGHGATTGDSHNTLPVVSLPALELDRRHVRPYETLIGRGTGDLVMTAHVWFPVYDPGTNAWPATLSQTAIGTILRGRIGFDGVVITDAFSMAGIQDTLNTYTGSVIAVQVGIDIILMPPNVADSFNGIRDAITSGAITPARIDQSVRRILRLKSRVGLPESAMVADADRARTMLHPEHVALAETIGRGAIASARVQPGVLPLTTQQDILCLTLSANSTIFYLYPASEFTTPLLAALPNVTVQSVSTSPSASTIASIVASAPNYDRIVVTSRMWRPFNAGSQDLLVAQLVATGVPVIYCSFGSPYHHLNIPGLQNIYCSFSSHYSSQREMVDVLVGASEPQARWPVGVGFNPKTNGWLAE